MSIKKRAKKLHIIAYLSLVLFVALMFVAGLYSASVLSDGGAALVSFTKILFSGFSIALLYFIVLVVTLVAAFILLLVKAITKKRDGFLLELIHVILVYVVLFVGGFLLAAYKEQVAKTIGAAFSNFSAFTGHDFAIAIAYFVGLVALVTYLLIELFLYFEVVNYCDKPLEDYTESDDLTEDAVRTIIREELLNFYADKNNADNIPEQKIEPVDTPVVVQAEEAVQEEPVVEEIKEDIKEETVEEKEPVVEVSKPVVNEAAESLASLHLTSKDLSGAGRVSFVERLLVADDELLDIYNELKNHMLAYGVNSRLSASGDTFRLHRVTYMKMTISGKKIKIYLALNPNDYKDSTIPYTDVGGKKAFSDIPFCFKVKSGLSLRRAHQLIDETMTKAGIVQKEEIGNKDFARDLVRELNKIKNS